MDYMWRPPVSVITALYCCNYFSSSSVLLRAFSALYVYSKFRHHPHPLGYLCAKFHLFRGLHCWASPWRKITYSITHSPSLFAFALQNIETIYTSSSNGGNTCTVKPLMFACPLFCKPNKTAKLKGTNITCRPKIREKLLQYFKLYMVLICQNKRGQNSFACKVGNF